MLEKLEQDKVDNFIKSLQEEINKNTGALTIRYLDISVQTAQALLKYINQLEAKLKEKENAYNKAMRDLVMARTR